MYRYYKMLLNFGIVKLAIIGGILVIAVTAGIVWMNNQPKATLGATTETLPTPVIIPKDFKLVRQSGGGLAGKGDGNDMTVTVDGKLTLHKTNEVKYLTFGDLEKLVKELKAVDYFSLDSTYSAEGTCPDTVGAGLSVTMDGKTKQVSWGDCQSKKLPDGMVKLNQHLYELAGIK